MEFKLCYTCKPKELRDNKNKIGVWLPIFYFGVCAQAKSGYRHTCKKCRREMYARNYKAKPKKIKKRTIVRWKFENNYLVTILNQTTRQIHDNSQMLDMQEIIR